MSIPVKDFDAAGLQALSRLRLAFRVINTSNTSGEERSKMRGRSAELIDFRQYVAGDDPRDIDWNAVARHDELYTKIYAQEIAQPIEIFIDIAPSMRWGKELAKLEQATTLALALADVAARSGASTKIVIDGKAPIVHQRGKSLLGTRLQIASFPLSESPHALDEILLDRAKQRTRAMIVVISDGYELESLAKSMAHLRARGHGIAFLQVLCGFELSPHLEADHTLVAEAERVRVSGNEDTLARYGAELTRFLEQWRREMARINAPYGMIEAEHSLLELATKDLPLSGLVARP